jgi:hypothetical protein
VPAFGNHFLAVAVEAFVVLPLSTIRSRFFSKIRYGWISAARRCSFGTVIQWLSSRSLLVEHCFFLMSGTFTLTLARVRIQRANAGLIYRADSLRHAAPRRRAPELNVFVDAALPIQQSLSGTVRPPQLAGRSVHPRPCNARGARRPADVRLRPDKLQTCLARDQPR